MSVGSPKTHPRAKLPITDPTKVWVYGFLSVDGNRKLVSAIMGKTAVAPQKCILEQNSQLPDPPKVWVFGFPSVHGNGKLVLAITENGKNGHSSPKTCPRTKLSITDPS